MVGQLKKRLSGSPELGWTAAEFGATPHGVRRIMGQERQCILKAALDKPSNNRSLFERAKAA